MNDKAQIKATYQRLRQWLATSYLTPVIAVFVTVALYFLAQIIGVNLLAIFLAVQGWTIDEIQSWLDEAVVGKFIARFIVAAVGIWLVYGVLKIIGATWQSIGLKRTRIKDLFYALAGYGWYLLFYFIAAAAAAYLFPAIDFDQSQELGFSTAATGNELVLIFMSLVLLPPLYEEILMRGFLLKGLRNKLSKPIAAIIVSILFAAGHLQWGSEAPLLWVAAIDTFVLSMVLVYLREKTGSLWPAIGLHTIKNFVAFMLLFVFKVQ